MMSDDLAPVWRALADVSRRQILDTLLEGPRTTGDLCQLFAFSRFAVMKHLGILETAGLVVVRRQGRERWNHLNPIPIREIHERWVRPYQAEWAARMLRLRNQIEEGKGEEHMSNQLGVVQVELEITIQAKPSRVWEALVSETSQWWLKDFYTNPSAKAMVIDPRLGGHVYEDWGDGAGQIWYTVIGLNPPESIMMQGILAPAFGGPSMTILQLVLKASGRKTVLQLSDSIFGRVGDDKLAETRDGWKLLFDGGLKAYVELHGKPGVN